MPEGKFSAEYLVQLDPLCSTCKHRSKVSSALCLAFPKGIPMDIITGKVDHTKPANGDQGIRYEKSK